MRWYKPYKQIKGELRPNPHIPWLDSPDGVYLIRRIKTGRIHYVGHSKSSIYKTLYRHFQDWSESDQYRATYPKKGYEIALIPTRKDRVKKLEKFLTVKIRPKDAEVKYQSYKPQQETKKNIKRDLKGAEAEDILPEESEEAPF